MSRYIPLTDLDSNSPALWIDAQAPLCVLHDAAIGRIRMVTEALEEFVGEVHNDRETCIPSAWAKVLALQLREGYDLLDVLGRSLNFSIR